MLRRGGTTFLLSDPVMENSSTRKYVVQWFLRSKWVIYELWLQEIWEKTHKYEKKIRKIWQNGVNAYSDVYLVPFWFRPGNAR